MTSPTPIAMRATALVAEDEPALAKTLVRMLAEAWPTLSIAKVVGDGVSAIDQALEYTPDVIFLDILMPGKTGLQAAATIADEWPDGHAEPLLVFVTAYDEFAVEAFAHAAVDYLLKPATKERLEHTVRRVHQRLAQRLAVPPVGDMAALMQRVQGIALAPEQSAERITVIRAAVGNTVRMIPLSDVICFEATEKYVTVVTESGEALLRISLRELMARIESTDFIQVHRSLIVHGGRVISATRDESGQLTLSLRGLKRPVKVSRAFSHLFRPM